MNNLESKVDQLQKDIEYIKSMMEDLTMTFSNNQNNKTTIVEQMETMKKLFSMIPGISPEIKQSLEKIFDRAAGGNV